MGEQDAGASERLAEVAAALDQLLAGRPPFIDRAPQIYFQHYFEVPPDPHTFAPEIPEACIRVLMRALAKAPSDRYQSAAEMRGELEALLRDPSATENDFQFLGPSSSYS